MELFYLSIAIFASISVESSLALMCYQCSTGVPGQTATPNCADPFIAEGLETVDCTGQCYAQLQSSTTEQGTFEITERGCKATEECTPQPLCVDSPQGRFCSYCCDDADTCNSKGVEETIAAATPGGIQCYSCNAEITESDPAPGSCASDDFSGEGEITISCQGKCISLKSPANANSDGNPASFMRACDMQGFCAMETGAIPEGYERTCCDSNLCNVGSSTPGAMPETNDGDDSGDGTTNDDDDNEGAIECWQCNSMVANGTDEQTVCYTGMFPADDIKKSDCPSGKCISYTYAEDGAGKMISRGCVTPLMDQMGLCGENSTAVCCTTSLCNKANSASAIAASVATIISAVFVFAFA